MTAITLVTSTQHYAARRIVVCVNFHQNGLIFNSWKYGSSGRWALHTLWFVCRDQNLRGFRSADLSVWEAQEVGCRTRFLAGRGKRSLPACRGRHTRFPIVVACHECQGGHVPRPHTWRPVLAGATSPAATGVPAFPDAEESRDGGAIFVLFLLRVHDKGLKLTFRKTESPKQALPQTKQSASAPAGKPSVLSRRAAALLYSES